MTLWAAALAAVAVLALMIIPSWGAWKFSPHRARNVKYAEREQLVIEHVVEARLSHPEIVKVSRIDRHPFFVLTHLAVFGYSWCVIAGAPLTNNVATLTHQTRYTMATCFLVGSTLVLTGATLGARIGRWTVMRSIHDHLTASVLGDDIALPYRLSMAGMFAVAVSMAIYSTTSFRTTLGSLGGWLTAAGAAACIVTIMWFWRRVRTFERWETTLITDAMARLGIEGARVGE